MSVLPSVSKLFRTTGEPMPLERLVELTHRHLGLDALYVLETSSETPCFRAVAGDCYSFGIRAGEGPATGVTYSRLLIEGKIPEVIPDTSADPRVADLLLTSQSAVGAFIGVPLHYSDGTVYGAMCGLSHQPDPTLGPRDAKLLRAVADLVAEDFDEQRRRLELRQGIRGLIDRGAIKVAYQPIVDLREGTILGVEALARFPAPFGPPDEALSAARLVGMDLEVERLAIRQAWNALPLLRQGQFLTFNVTPESLLELGVRAQSRPDISLSSMVVEITEQAIVPSYSQLRNILAPLRERGLRIAIDDAGAGWASLHHVVELRPDFIKIDRSLVNGVSQDRGRRVAISAFVLLALDLNSGIIAEGVETPADLSALCDLGIDAAQGYVLGRPSTSRRQLRRWTAPNSRLRFATPPATSGSDGPPNRSGQSRTPGVPVYPNVASQGST